VYPAEPKVKLEPETKSEGKVKQESVSESEYEVKASRKRTHRGKRGGRKHKQCSTSTPDSGASGATAARSLPPLASTHSPDARRSLQGPSPHRDDAASVAQDEHVDHHAERDDMTSIGNTAIAEEAQQLPGDIRTDMREMLAKINRLGKLLKTLSSNGSGHG
jgi:hypothetical protein